MACEPRVDQPLFTRTMIHFSVNSVAATQVGEVECRRADLERTWTLQLFQRVIL